MSDVKLELLKQIAHGLAAQFGSDCEVAIHDLSRNSVENSIVYIENGQVTGRSVGEGLSGVVLKAIKHPDAPKTDHLAYLSKTASGRILRCSTLYINDDSGRPHYILSINYDITNLLALENSIHYLTGVQPEEADSGSAEPGTVPIDVNSLLDELINQADRSIGTPAPLMNREEKIRAINFLNEAGAFLITKAGDRIAEHFGISKYTLYNYVNINK
ncbi:MAG: helix-turn-helix transcriptional regulator [Lachnospiraceae bacterium]|nr:helix-turn-helix transcriptional regulator [Lachnospiraceae bacterium]